MFADVCQISSPLYCVSEQWRLWQDIGSKYPIHMSWLKRYAWAASSQNQQNDLCAQRSLRSAWASAQSDQSLHCVLNRELKAQCFFMRTAKTLIRLGGCPGWSDSSLGARHSVGFVMRWLISYGTTTLFQITFLISSFNSKLSRWIESRYFLRESTMSSARRIWFSYIQ